MTISVLCKNRHLHEFLKFILKVYYYSGSSSVDFTGFLSVYAKCDKIGDSEEDFDEAFRVFDKEGNGQISAAEMRHMLTNLGEKMTDTQTDAFMAFAEPDAQGEIDYKSMY